MLEKANAKEALNGRDFSKYITPYTLNAVLSSGSSQRYEVGDVIISTKPDDPTIRFGGTWQLLCPGRTMVCIDVNDSSFNTVKKTGGSKYMQSHSHTIGSIGSGTAWVAPNFALTYQYTSNNLVPAYTHTAGTGDSGNLQPYMVVYIWEKVA